MNVEESLLEGIMQSWKNRQLLQEGTVIKHIFHTVFPGQGQFSQMNAIRFSYCHVHIGLLEIYLHQVQGDIFFRCRMNTAKDLDSDGRRELVSRDAWSLTGLSPAGLRDEAARTAWRTLAGDTWLSVCLSLWTTSAPIPNQADETER